MKTGSTGLIMASLKAGKEVVISQRDYLTIIQYCENVGIGLTIVKKDKLMLTVRMKTS